MEIPFKVKSVPGSAIGDMLNVSTGACTYCGGATRVPENVVAVIEQDDVKTPIIVCDACLERFVEDMGREVHRD